MINWIQEFLLQNADANLKFNIGFQLQMYILASYFLEKVDKLYLKLVIRAVCMGIFSL